MSRTARLALFAAAAAGFAAVLVIAFTGLPGFGHYHGVDGLVLDGVGVSERHATDLITALNFDVRGFDTLGEEFILFASVLGISLILRELRGDGQRPSEEEAEEHVFGGSSEALRAFGLVLVPMLIAVGIYVVVHGQLTPGGGFQGGVIIAAGPLSVFLAGRYLRLTARSPRALVEAGEAAGALGYALVGLGGLVFTGVFFRNFLPLGTAGHILSAGQMDIASIAVGVEVSGAFLVAWGEFSDQAILIRRGGKR